MPLSLSDDEYNAVRAAAAPIHPLQRDAFLKALAVELERHPVVGPGVVHRAAAVLQKTFVVAAHSETSHSAEPRHLRARRAARWAGKLAIFRCVCANICEPNADKGETWSNTIRRRHLNAGQCAIMLAEAYPEPKRGMHSQSRARALCKLGRGSKLEHYGRGRDYRSSSVLAFSPRPALGP
jgi:hypothetical protein